MKKILGVVKTFFTSKEAVETVVDGVKVVGKNKLNKKKIALVVTIVIAILLLTGVISEETFIELFKNIN